MVCLVDLAAFCGLNILNVWLFVAFIKDVQGHSRPLLCDGLQGFWQVQEGCSDLLCDGTLSICADAEGVSGSAVCQALSRFLVSAAAKCI